VWGDHYPADEKIASQTARNKNALLYFLTVGSCPYSAVGLARQDCGPFFDDVEISRGWRVNPDGTDTAPTSARFTRGDPQPTSAYGLRMQPDRTTSGRYAFVTGRLAGSGPNSYDLDGRSTLQSVPIALPDAPGNLTFRYIFSHGRSSASDSLRVFIEDAANVRTLVWQKVGTSSVVGAAWRTGTAALTPWAGQSVRIVIQATDGGYNGLVEALIDDVRVENPA
ncbi:MAG TPA: hypothetical protein VK194_10145, partial [Candidatus Deferrimicrobium sp.]|nr:hypothetical protein [Candidatus Deferrimicrobium sp.]